MEALESVNLSVLERWQVEVPRHLEALGLGLFEIVIRPMAVPKHVHDTAFFCILLDGEFESDYGGTRFPFSTSVNVFHPSSTVHTSQVGRQGARLLTVEANADWIERAEAHGVLPKRPLPLARDDGWPARRLLRELRHATPCSLLAIEGLALEMLAGAMRPARTPIDKPAWLDRAHQLVCADFDQPLTLSEVATRVGAEPARLSAAFRRRYGQSIGELVRTLRVQFVCDTLATGRPLADIAFAAGFADQAHCTRIFKRRMGVTPGAYRSAMRQCRPGNPRPAAPRRGATD